MTAGARSFHNLRAEFTAERDRQFEVIDKLLSATVCSLP